MTLLFNVSLRIGPLEGSYLTPWDPLRGPNMTQNRSYFDPLLAGGPIFKGATLGVLAKTPPKEGPKIGSNMTPGTL